MENLVHVRLPLLPCHSGEEQARYEKVGAAKSSEDVAFKFLHLRSRSRLKLNAALMMCVLHNDLIRLFK